MAIAAGLAYDPAWRADIRRRVGAGKHRLFRDRTAIAALEAFLDRAVRNNPALVSHAAPPYLLAHEHRHRNAGRARIAA